jgi:hypothetical protein
MTERLKADNLVRLAGIKDNTQARLLRFPILRLSIVAQRGAIRIKEK